MTKVTRRDFLKTLALGSAGLVAGCDEGFLSQFPDFSIFKSFPFIEPTWEGNYEVYGVTVTEDNIMTHEYRMLHNNHHFMTLVEATEGDYMHYFQSLKTHPGPDYGSRSTIFMSPSNPEEILEDQLIDIYATEEGIKVESGGYLSNPGGMWRSEALYEYLPDNQKAGGEVNMRIVKADPDKPLDILTLQSQYLTNVTLQNGDIVDTGDMQYIDVEGDWQDFTWTPIKEEDYPEISSSKLSIDMIGNFNEYDGEGYTPAQKPDVNVQLLSFNPMTFNAQRDALLNEPQHQNIVVSPTIQKPSNLEVITILLSSQMPSEE